MSAPSVDGAEPTPAPPGQRIRENLERLAVAAIDRLAGAAADKVDDLADQLEEMRTGGGVKLGAMFGAGTALMSGTNPVWGAIRGAWGALGVPARVGVVLLLILAAVLAPVLLLVALVALLIAAAVSAAR